MEVTKKRIKQGFILGIILVLVLTGAFFAADYVRSSPSASAFIAQFGYGGVILLATIAGLNVFIPVPSASFVPIFTEVGLWLPGIILSLTIGTIIADYIGFVFGHWGRKAVVKKYPKPMERFERLYDNHRKFLPYVIFLYAAFMPLPNEAIVLPLAVLGVPFRTMLIPLFIGNLVNQTIFSYGIQNVFTWLF